MKPILFSGPMVKAILDGDKTMTRRIIKPQPEVIGCGRIRWKGDIALPEELSEKYAPRRPGDILWVRETWATESDAVSGEKRYLYTVGDGTEKNYRLENGELRKWRPSIHMPKEAARIFLRVTKVSVERLQDILLEDIAREALAGLIPTSTLAFRRFWDSLRKPSDLKQYGWDANPWVWVISFERCEKPEARDG